MSCLIVSATSFEIKPFLHILRSSQDESLARMEIDVLITGVGLLPAAYAIGRQILIKRPALIIQAGIGGCFSRKVPLGSVVVVARDTVADLGVMEDGKWRSVFDMELTGPRNFPWYDGWLVNGSEMLQKSKLPRVSAISVNEVSTSKQKIKAFKDLYDPVVESLEGAALHYVALMENIPFLQIRALSNYVGERNKSKWQLDESVSSLNAALINSLLG